MASQKKAGQSLVNFTNDKGILYRLKTDGALEYTGHNTMFTCNARKMRIKLSAIEQIYKNQNSFIKREIGIHVTYWKHQMKKMR
eukprot:6238868-Ditylum_brightwellii.AAC.1